jgi:hypothetical protein
MCLTHISAAGLTNSHVIKQEQILCNIAQNLLLLAILLLKLAGPKRAALVQQTR